MKHIIFEYYHNGFEREGQRKRLKELLDEGWQILNSAPTESKIVYILKK